jgi:hypothetical protein
MCFSESIADEVKNREETPAQPNYSSNVGDSVDLSYVLSQEMISFPSSHKSDKFNFSNQEGSALTSEERGFLLSLPFFLIQ